MNYPIENDLLLVETVKAALAAKADSLGFDVGEVVKSAVASVIDADRAYRIYLKELSGKSRQGQ